MKWLGSPSGRSSRRRLRRTTIAARDRLSAIVAEVERPAASPIRIRESEAMPEAPILVLLAPSRGFAGRRRTSRAGRTATRWFWGSALSSERSLAAQRARLWAGLSLRRQRTSATPWLPASPIGATSPRRSSSSRAAPLIIAPAAILAEADWLERLASTQIEPAAWAANPEPDRHARRRLGAGAADALDGTAARKTWPLSKAGSPACLARQRRFRPPSIRWSCETPADVRAAERRLLRSLVKDTDGFMARHVERPISLADFAPPGGNRDHAQSDEPDLDCGRNLRRAVFPVLPRPLMQTIGALLFLAHSILDGCDGELARLKFQQSRWGGVLDFWGDNVVHTVIFGCMGVGWSLAAGSLWPLALGAGAVLGTLGSAGFVYWRLMRAKDGGETLFTSVSDAPGRPLTRLLDSASRRDFIYLVILLALFGRSNWFLVMAGIGAPIYFLLVLLAARPQASLEAGGSAGAPEPIPR